MPHIFISYAKKDTRQLALSLADALNALADVTAWVDRSLRAGKAWELQIQAEIDRCDVMVVLYSPDINRHKNGEPESYVLTEIAYAKWTAHKPIIPVMVQRTDPPISLTLEHYIDFTLAELTLDELTAALCAEMGIALPVPAPASPSAPALVRPTSVDLLPAPFAWVEIPDKSYSIAKYPITNAQFAKFIEAGGYEAERWWPQQGWQQRQKSGWTAPRYWKVGELNGAEQPVVGVSWYEAAAFCLWLNDVTGEKIMLPTEDQWQYAAQGDDGRDYPWGQEWDGSRCNNNVDRKGIGKTLPVRAYEGKGDSPFGVVDMAGNVWEWCLTAYESRKNELTRTDARVLRGGSWNYSHTGDFRCSCRGRGDPDGRSNVGGFRLLRS